MLGAHVASALLSCAAYRMAVLCRNHDRDTGLAHRCLHAAPKVAFKAVGAGIRAANGEYHANLTAGPGSGASTPRNLNPRIGRLAFRAPAPGAAAAIGRRFYRAGSQNWKAAVTIHYEGGAWWWGRSYSTKGAMYTHPGPDSKVPTTGWTALETAVHGGKAPAPTLLVHVSPSLPAHSRCALRLDGSVFMWRLLPQRTGTDGTDGT